MRIHLVPALVVCVLVVSGANARADDNRPSAVASPPATMSNNLAVKFIDQKPTDRLGSKLIGASIVNGANATIGTISDIVFDERNTIRAFVVIALVVGILLALMGWGVVHSVRVDSADRSLDAAIEQAVAAAPQRFGQLCNCGHEHDPTELHITDAEPAPCQHDGGGAACAHDCASCVLGSLRPSPTQTRAERLTS